MIGTIIEAVPKLCPLGHEMGVYASHESSGRLRYRHRCNVCVYRRWLSKEGAKRRPAKLPPPERADKVIEDHRELAARIAEVGKLCECGQRKVLVNKTGLLAPQWRCKACKDKRHLARIKERAESSGAGPHWKAIEDYRRAERRWRIGGVQVANREVASGPVE